MILNNYNQCNKYGHLMGERIDPPPMNYMLEMLNSNANLKFKYDVAFWSSLFLLLQGQHRGLMTEHLTV